MDKRQKELAELHSYVETVDKEITMILQSLQWDRKHLLEGATLVQCKYDCNHRVPPDKEEAHEEKCFLQSEGYAADDRFLPDTVDDDAPTLVRLCKEEVANIIDRAAAADPSFKRGRGVSGLQRWPLTAERMQATFTADERRAIHDAVSAAPAADHADHLTLPGTSQEGKQRPKSKLEVLAELRDMRRRRAKYRTSSAASRNYSNVLRDVIKTQMELFTGVQVKDEPEDNTSNKTDKDTRGQVNHRHNYDRSDNSRDEKHEKYKDKHKTERYRDTSHSKDDKRNYDSAKEKHYLKEDKEKDRHAKYRSKCDVENERGHEKHSKKHKKYTSSFSEEENRHSSKKRDDDGRDKERYSTKRDSYRDSEHRSERNYKKEKYEESLSSSKRHREHYADKYEESIQKKRGYKKREDDVSHHTKRRRY